MPVEGLDHIAITVTDVAATVEWYQRVLGAQSCSSRRGMRMNS